MSDNEGESSMKGGLKIKGELSMTEQIIARLATQMPLPGQTGALLHSLMVRI